MLYRMDKYNFMCRRIIVDLRYVSKHTTVYV